MPAPALHHRPVPSTMSTILRHDLHHDDEEDVSDVTFHTARTSSFSIDDVDDAVSSRKISTSTSTYSDDSGMEVIMWSARNQQDGAGLLMQHYLRRKMLRMLRQGKNGDTYLAELKDKKKVRTLYAIKTMHKGMLMLCRMSRALIETERNVLNSLHHPFLPSVHADIESEDYLFLVMDFCPGGDLRALLRCGPLREEAARFYAVEVLLALEYLHMCGIVHRDLKPENVLIKADGHIMLSGFDHARFFRQHDTEERRRESQEGRVRDVRIPPEVFKGREHDNVADLYSFGVFLYELLFGTPPPPLHDVDRPTTCTCMGLGRQPLKFPQTPAVSPAARDLLRRLLEKDPERRLGQKRGTGDVRRHAFFRGINFAYLQRIADGCLKPPRLPNKFYRRK